MPSAPPTRRARAAAVVTALVSLLPACGVQGRAAPTLLPFSPDKTTIYAADGTVITTLRGEEDREPVPLAKVPMLLQNAVVAIEDERFWQHNGVDPKGILRAAKSNSDDEQIQGGSTITQQYVKTALLSPERTIQRKIEEANLALQLEKTYSKDFILEQYLNTIYFGRRAYGVQVASKTYFGKDVSDLNLAESSLLAGLIQSPSGYNPYRHPDKAIKRRNVVLAKMLQLGDIAKPQYDAAVATPLELSGGESDAVATDRYSAPHFVEEVKKFIRNDPRFGRTAAERRDLLYNGGLKIYTTIDLTMQAEAEKTIKSRLPDQARAITDSRKDPDAALVSIDPVSGYVKAMVGGYDYFDSDTRTHPYAQVNLAVGTGRQSGSTFKAITLATALSNGIGIDDTFPAPGKATITYPGAKPWVVNSESYGRANLTTCIVHSVNSCFGYLIADKRVGPEKVTGMASRMGIHTGPESGFKTVLSETLGSNNSTVLDMASAYATIADRGIHVPPVLVTRVVRSDGTILYQRQYEQHRVLTTEIADTMTKAMEGVVSSGTGRRADIGRPQAGKTGTTQQQSDGWFIGWTPELVTAVWVGYAEPLPPSRRNPNGGLRTIGANGGDIAAPIWAQYTKAVLGDSPARDFAFGPEATPQISLPPVTTVAPGNSEIFQAEDASQTATMPDLLDGNVNRAASRVKSAGLKLRRIDVTVEGAKPGQVVAQSPAPGSVVPKGAEVIVEATPGQPPPTTPIPDVTGQLVTDAQASLTKTGYAVTVTPAAPPVGFLLPNGLAPTSGQVWQIAPAVGTVSPDGKLTLTVVP